MSNHSTQWWSKDTIAIVTGSNKGLGFAIARGLALKGVTTVLTARDEYKGLEALNTLKEQHQEIDPAALHFHVLDVTSPSSIREFAQWIKAKFGRLDILINNAGIGNSSMTMTVETSKLVIDTNYYGARMVTESLLSLFSTQSPHGARIINVSSAASRMDALRHQAALDKLSDVDNLSTQIIDELVEEFIKDVKHGQVAERGWSPIFGAYEYCFSKLALNAYTGTVARDASGGGGKIFVNCICPGLTSTDMTKNNGHSAEVGADTAIWLALLPAAESKTGTFFSRRQETGFDHIPLYMENGSSAFLDEFDLCVRTLSAPKHRHYFKV